MQNLYFFKTLEKSMEDYLGKGKGAGGREMGDQRG
jgi:hypothetical protein